MGQEQVQLMIYSVHILPIILFIGLLGRMLNHRTDPSRLPSPTFQSFDRFFRSQAFVALLIFASYSITF